MKRAETRVLNRLFGVPRPVCSLSNHTMTLEYSPMSIVAGTFIGFGNFIELRGLFIIFSFLWILLNGISKKILAEMRLYINGVCCIINLKK